MTLDGLRGIAALAIVTLHAPKYFQIPFFEAYLAVDFFFVLSGFILAHAYGQRLADELSALDFMKIRIVRLYPLYALSLVLTAVPILLGFLRHGMALTVPLAISFIFATLFLPRPGTAGDLLFPLNPPSWSLFFELIANAGFGLISPKIGNRMLAMIVLVAALVLIAAVLNEQLGFGFASATGIMDNGWEWGSIGAGFVRVTYSFFCGVLTYRIWSVKKLSIDIPPLGVAAALFAVLAVHPPDSCQVAYDLIATLIVFPVLVWFGANSAVSGFTASLFSLLGISSYGVYVLQAPLYMISWIILYKVNPGITGGWNYGLGLIGFVFTVTLVADHYFDRPIRRALMLRVRRKEPFSTGTAKLVSAEFKEEELTVRPATTANVSTMLNADARQSDTSGRSRCRRD